MKKMMSVVEVEGEGLNKLLGERVIVVCDSYFYAGKLEGVNDNDILLTDACIVFDAGDWTKNKGGKFGSKEAVGRDLYVRTSKIESYCLE